MKMSLKVKAITVILIFTVILSSCIVFISYKTYTDSFEKHYSSLALSISKSTATVIDSEKVKIIADEVDKTYNSILDENGGSIDFESFSEEDFERYFARFEYVTKLPEYNELLDILTKLRLDNDAKSLYLGYTDIETMRDVYLVDSSAEMSCYPGTCDDVRPEHIEKIKSGDYEFPAFITNYPEYGWLCSASAPITDSDGNVIGVALVDISMNKIMQDIQGFLLSLILITAIAALIVVLLVSLLVNKSMLKPINVLSNAASSFVTSKKDGSNAIATEIQKLNIKTGDEIQMLSESVKKMEEDINTYIEELTSATAEKERIGAELDVANRIQASMLPCIFPAFPERKEFDIYATMTPAKEVGGDFYDFFMVDEDNLAIVMADVSGKGVPAALFMVIGKTLIKDHTTSGKDLGDVFTEVNRLLCEANSEELFITAFVGVLNLKTGVFRYVNAGHEIPFIAKKNEKFKPYKIRAAFVLAGMDGIKYKAGELQIEPGDKIFQYTDGVTEAMNKNNELFGMDRLEKTLGNLSDKTPSEILKGIKNDVDKFVGDAEQFDDITMLCLEYIGEPEAFKSVDLSLSNISNLTSFVEDTLKTYEVSTSTIIKMNIALDEIYSNIVKFSGATYAKIFCGVKDGNAYIRFEDDGVRYNPLEKEDTDITLSAQEREIGGLGIFMVKKSMDTIEYDYKDSKNILTLLKKK